MNRFHLQQMSSLKSRFKLCTFDVTNTLLKFKTSVGEQYTEIGRLYGVERDSSQITAAFEHHWKVLNANHPNFGRNTGLTSHMWWKEMVRRTFSVGCTELTNEQLEKISDHLYKLYKSSACWNIIPGAENLLKHLKQKQVLLGVISNFDERLDCVLLSNGLKSYFDFVLASYVVQVAKPSKKIFDLALSQISGISPNNAVHIGDNLKLDYLAAKNAGWNALLISDKVADVKTLEFVNPNEVVCNIEKIENYFFSS